MKYPGKQAVQIIQAPHLGGSLGQSISPLLSSMERFEESHPRVKLSLNTGISELSDGHRAGEVKVLKLPGIDLTRQSYIVYLKEKPLSATTRQFLPSGCYVMQDTDRSKLPYDHFDPVGWGIFKL
jgi:hypothetical protein